jgi:hypothetical protein
MQARGPTRTQTYKPKGTSGGGGGARGMNLTSHKKNSPVLSHTHIIYKNTHNNMHAYLLEPLGKGQP